MKKILFLCIGLLFAGAALADGKTVYLTSLDWPPYSGKDLPGGGASVQVVRAAFAAMGYNLKVDFFPWSRTVVLAKDQDSKYAGYFPEYYSESVAESFHYSHVMGSGPLGFAERADDPVEWHSHDDLANYPIGVVQDYVNEAEFDRRVADGRIRVQAVTSDATNLVKLVNGRIDMAVVDRNVMEYLVKTDRRLKNKADQLRFNERMLENKMLYVCFKKNALGEKMLKVFNEGLKKIDADAIMAKGMQY
ncbi:MAG: transporter substrate-binding domain-containing protein [Ketobacteraceae bacterium]|nr:transporter substrate-binding domain-containing protein [Ketobacteraceae bacterium]